MKVHAVHVDRLYLDEGRALTESVRYEFDEPTWVSAHRGRNGTRLGPLTALDGVADDPGLDDTSVVHFEPYPLPTDDDGTRVSYRDTWTIPRGTAYVVVLPPEFVVEHLAVKRSTPGRDHYYSLETESTPEGAIFYRTVVEFDGPTNVQLRARRDREAWADRLDEIGVVDPPVDRGAPVDVVREKSPSSSFYLLLLELRELF